MLKTVGFPSTRTGDQTIVNGNLVIGTAGKGIDFSADPSTPGMTSELLDDYEEGTWTATLLDGVNTITTLTGVYTKVGRLVSALLYAPAGYSGIGLTGAFTITGLPFTPAADSCGTSLIQARAATIAIRAMVFGGLTTVYFYTTSTETQATTNQILTNAAQNQRVYFSLTYNV